MMGQPKPFAALSSGLLARKGQAKPAMRPQGYSGFGAVSEAIDDLGWNDMGQNDTQPGPAPATASAPAALPPVLRERHALTEEVEAVPMPAVAAPSVAIARPVALAPATPPDHKPPVQRHLDVAIVRSTKAKTAFTLRLDGDRHLRLRLASVLRHQSAQQLVTEALDCFLKTLPEVEAMANRLSAGAGNDMADGG